MWSNIDFYKQKKLFQYDGITLQSVAKVQYSEDLEISKSVDLIRENLEMPQKSQLHWKLLKGMPNKKMIMDIVSRLDIKIINVIIDTKCIQFIPSNNIYNILLK